MSWASPGQDHDKRYRRAANMGPIDVRFQDLDDYRASPAGALRGAVSDGELHNDYQPSNVAARRTPSQAAPSRPVTTASTARPISAS
jgi:hypothetical protein